MLSPELSTGACTRGLQRGARPPSHGWASAHAFAPSSAHTRGDAARGGPWPEDPVPLRRVLPGGLVQVSLSLARPLAPAGPEFPAGAEQVAGRLHPELAPCRAAAVPVRCHERARGAAGMAEGVKLPRACHGLGQPSCCSSAGQGSLEGSSPWSPACHHPNASVQTPWAAQGLQGCPWRPAGTIPCSPATGLVSQPLPRMQSRMARTPTRVPALLPWSILPPRVGSWERTEPQRWQEQDPSSF